MQVEDLKDTIQLYKSQDIYKRLSKNDIAQHLIPSISLNQYKVFDMIILVLLMVLQTGHF